MDSEENKFDKLHRLTSDRDRRNITIKDIERQIGVLTSQLQEKERELSELGKIRDHIEEKIKILAKEF
jgi:chromosome segregation ATPase